jgi:hypothetical protein
MAEIFVSYRRGDPDAWVAGRLADRLARSFDVFFDGRTDAIDFGSSFSQEIDDALGECRVLFAVIGPDWLSVKNMSRLHSDDDWVRHELRFALQNERRIRVVPVLVESDAPPAASLLPQDLQSLSGRQGVRLDRTRWEISYREIERRLPMWLTPETRDSMPPELPFLCDRRDQEDALVDLVRSAGSSTGFMACVVHGHKWECHQQLLDRFREERGVLDQVFRSEEGTACHYVQLNRTRLKAGRFDDALKSALKAKLGDLMMSDSELATFFRTLAQPLVVVAQLTWEDYQVVGPGAVKSLVQAWQGLATTAPNGAVERLPHPALLWINVTYEEPDYELPADVLHSPLPKLCAVEEGHIREWVGLDRVKPYVSAKKRDLLRLASDGRYCHTPGKLHMDRFADAVRDIIADV